MSQEFTLNLKLSCEPRVAVRVVLPSDDKATVKSKKKKQFINKKMCVLTVDTGAEQWNITAYKDYCFDSASIPFGIGKGDTRLFVPALFHDIMCDNKECIGCNRHLSSLVFRELLLMCNVPKWKAQVMYLAVDNYQKFMEGWKKC
ncbi:MAG: DUF1353 domain-containing protein [Clostridia bacterium]|nr:DUF1353 domain-containing protein [Clostridia bacterium]